MSRLKKTLVALATSSVLLLAAAGCGDDGGASRTDGGGGVRPDDGGLVRSSGDADTPPGADGEAIAACIQQCESDHPAPPPSSGEDALRVHQTELTECWQCCSTKYKH